MAALVVDRAIPRVHGEEVKCGSCGSDSKVLGTGFGACGGGCAARVKYRWSTKQGPSWDGDSEDKRWESSHRPMSCSWKMGKGDSAAAKVLIEICCGDGGGGGERLEGGRPW